MSVRFKGRGMGMSSSDNSYYRQRAREERERAFSATRRDVAAIHEELARQYQALIDKSEPRPARPIVMDDEERQMVSA